MMIDATSEQNNTEFVKVTLSLKQVALLQLCILFHCQSDPTDLDTTLLSYILNKPCQG